MCLAIPGKIISIKNDHASVSFAGVIKEINISLLQNELAINDYVLVHAGFAIEKIDKKLAENNLKAYEEKQKFDQQNQ